MQLVVLIVDVAFIIEKGDWPKLWGNTPPELFRGIIEPWVRSQSVLPDNETSVIIHSCSANLMLEAIDPLD